MKLTNGFSPEEKKITISVETGLLGKYYNNFNGILKDRSKSLPEGWKVEYKSPNTAVISFPAPSDTTFKESETNKGSMLIGVNPKNIMPILDTIESFVNMALRYELKRTEFIPLNGYPIENLKEDVQVAVKGKRSFCIIGEYAEFLSMEKKREYKFHQYMVRYGTEDYSDVAVLLYEGKLDELREIYTPKLKLTEWC